MKENVKSFGMFGILFDMKSFKLINELSCVEVTFVLQ